MNEYPEKTSLSIDVDIKINPAAAFGIAVATVAGICFCVYTGMEHGYGANLGKLSLNAAKMPELIAA